MAQVDTTPGRCPPGQVHLAAAPRRALAWALTDEGSTRPAALLRIAVALILWSRFAAELAPHRAATGLELGLGVTFYLATTLLLVGLWTRFAALVTAASVAAIFYGLGLRLGHVGLIHHHTYLLVVVTALLALTPCGRSISLDRWLALRRRDRGGPAPAPERAGLWGMRLLAIQLVVLYLAAAIDKCTPAFLSGDRMEAVLMWVYDAGPLAGIDWRPLAQVASWATLGLELALGLGLLFPRTRRWLLIPGLLMHAIFYVAVPVSTFSVTMMALYLAVVDPDALSRGIDRLLGRADAGAPAP